MTKAALLEGVSRHPFILEGEGKGGHTPKEAPDSLFSNNIAHVLDMLGEGEIEGIPGATDEERWKNIFYNEVPVVGPSGESNFTGVAIIANNGRPDQPAMPGFDDVRTSVGVGQQLPANTPKTISFPNDGSVTAVIVTVSADQIFQVKDNGDTVGTSVSFRIERSQNGGTFTVVANPVISGKQNDEYTVDYRIPITDPTGTTAIRVTRTTPDSDSLKITDRIQFKTYTKVVEHKFSYPNVALVGHILDAKQFGNQIPQRQYRVRGIKCRVPHNYDPVARTYTGPFNGTLTSTKVYTNNPAWVFYEIVTNRRFGLGKYINPALLDIPSLYQTGKWCDDPVSNGKGGTEPRWSCNTVIRDRGEAFNLLKEMVSCFRGSLFWMQAKLWAVGDQPREPVKLVTNANVIQGKFTYSGESQRKRYSAINVTFNDPDLFFRRGIETVDDPDLIREIGYKTNDYGAFGCTSRAQARRLGRAILFSQEFESELVSYKASYDHMAVDGDGPDGLAPGDLILIADKKRGNAVAGGRVTGVDTSVLTLDREIDTPGTGTVYVEHAADGSIEWLTCTYTGDQVTLTESPTQPVQPNDLYIVIASGFDVETFVVLKIAQEEPNVLGVTAVKWDEDRYNAIYADVHLDTTKYMGLPKVDFVQPVASVTASDGYVTDVDFYQRVVDIEWTRSDDPYLSHYFVEYRYELGNWDRMPIVSGTSARIENARAGVYDIRVSAVNRAGRYSEPAVTQVILGIVPDEATLALGAISGLVLQSGGTAFSGRDAKFSWTVTTPESTVAAATGIALTDALTGISDQYFRDCVVTVRRADTNAILRSESIIDTSYVYTYEKNYEDTAGAPVRSFKIEVQYRDRFNRMSSLGAGSTLTVNNPSPVLPSTPVAVGVPDGVLVKCQVPADTDFAGIKVYMSLTNAFTPGVGNLVYQGPDTTVTLPQISASATHYLKVIPYDAYGDGTASLQFSSVPVPTSASIAAVQSALAVIDDDNVLTQSEKTTVLIPRYNELESIYQKMATLAPSFPVTTEFTAATTARTNWITYLGTLAPAWNNTSANTTIVRTGAGSFQSYLDAYTAALETLSTALTRYAAQTGNGVTLYTAYTNGTAVDIIGNSVTRTTATGSWNLLVASREVYRGGCSVRGQVPWAAGKNAIFGLVPKTTVDGIATNVNRDTSIYATLAYAIYVVQDGSVFAYETGTNQAQLGAVGSAGQNDVYEIIYDRGLVTYKINGAIKREVAAADGVDYQLGVTPLGTGTVRALSYSPNTVATPNQDAIFEAFNYGSAAQFQAKWLDTQNNGELVIVNTTDVGGKAIQIGNNAGNDLTQGRYWQTLPYTLEDVWEISFDVEVVATGANVNMYLGVQAQDANGNNLSGDVGSYLYVSAAQAQSVGRNTYKGYFRGRAAAGAGNAVGAVSPDVANPTSMPIGTASIRPLFIVNYPGIGQPTPSGQVRLHSMSLRKVLDVTIKPRGGWSSLTTYSKNDGVSYLGRYFGSSVDGNTNHAPPSSYTSNAYWYPISDKGDNGINGVDGTLSWTPILTNMTRVGSLFTSTASGWASNAVSKDKYSAARVSGILTAANQDMAIGLKRPNGDALTLYVNSGINKVSAVKNGATQFSTTVAPAVGMILEVAHIGTEIRGFINGVDIGTAIATGLATDEACTLFLNIFASGVSVDSVSMSRGGLPGLGSFSLIAQNNVTVTGNSVKKNDNTGSWDGKARTGNAFVAGASISAIFTGLMGIGLTTDPVANNSYDTVDYWIYMDGATTYYVYRNGANQGAVGTYAVNDRITVFSDNRNVYYMKTTAAGVTSLLYWHAVNTTNETLYGVVNLSLQNTVSGIEFSNSGPAGLDGLTPIVAKASPSNKNFTADYNGNVKAGQLPFDFAVTGTKAGVAIGGTIAILSTPVGCTASLIAGGIRIDTVIGDTCSVRWRFTATDGQVVEDTWSGSRTKDPVPPLETTSKVTSGVSWIGNGSYAATGWSVVLAAGASGIIDISFYSEFRINDTGISATSDVTAKLQYRPVSGGAWIDIGSTSSGEAFNVKEPGTPTEINAGYVNPTASASGLTAGASYEFQVVGVKTAGAMPGTSSGQITATQRS